MESVFISVHFHFSLNSVTTFFFFLVAPKRGEATSSRRTAGLKAPRRSCEDKQEVTASLPDAQKICLNAAAAVVGAF